MRPSDPLSALLANAVLFGHLLFVVFVVGGLAVIVIGGLRGWTWVRRPWLRGLHLAAIAIVVMESWLGLPCPLTVLEHQLRRAAGQSPQGGDWIATWLHSLLFFEAPTWVFTLSYTVFALAVAFVWWWLPPGRASDPD